VKGSTRTRGATAVCLAKRVASSKPAASSLSRSAACLVLRGGRPRSSSRRGRVEGARCSPGRSRRPATCSPLAAESGSVFDASGFSSAWSLVVWRNTTSAGLPAPWCGRASAATVGSGDGKWRAAASDGNVDAARYSRRARESCSREDIPEGSVRVFRVWVARGAAVAQSGRPGSQSGARARARRRARTVAANLAALLLCREALTVVWCRPMLSLRNRLALACGHGLRGLGAEPLQRPSFGFTAFPADRNKVIFVRSRPMPLCRY